MIGIYLAIGFGVWLGLATIRINWIRRERWYSIVLGFVGSVIAWPIMLYFADKD